jgi:hypothetical protein
MLNHHLSALVDQLRAEGIADPLAQSFTLAAIWDDLAAITGESPPAAVQAALGGARISPCAPSDSALPVSPPRACYPGDGGQR